MLPAVIAVVAARAGRPGWVAVFVVLSVMTKPQALPFLVPFAAWFLGSVGLRGTLRAALIGAAVAVLVWLPFLAAGGPVNYLDNLREYQDDIFSVLSLRAWNPWWILQVAGNGGSFASDTTAVLGPLTFRYLGFIVTGLLALVVFLGVYRRPTPERLVLGLAAVTLAAFIGLTTMHERYAYPAFVFLLMAATNRVVFVAWLAFAITFAANLVFAVPPPELALPNEPLIGVVGAIVISFVGLVTLVELLRPERRDTHGDVPTLRTWR